MRILEDDLKFTDEPKEMAASEMKTTPKPGWDFIWQRGSAADQNF